MVKNTLHIGGVMRTNRIIGLVLVVAGAICLVFSHYIAQEILIGEGKIQRGQKMVDTTNELFSQSQYTKPFGSFVTKGAQERIDAGNDEVAHYRNVVKTLKLSGVILIVVGVFIGFFYRKKIR